jgi:hypothetical protein
MLLVVIPRSFQLYDWELKRWREAFGLGDDQLDIDRPQRVLMEWARREKVPAIDLLPVFRSHIASGPDTRLYFYPNSHMNAAGHALAGRVIADTLVKLLSHPTRQSVESRASDRASVVRTSAPR